MKCCICENEIEIEPNGWSEGHNAQPFAKGRCCNDCNIKVMLERIRIMEGRSYDD